MSSWHLIATVIDQPICDAPLLARNFPEMRVEFLPECGNAGEIVAGEAASKSDDEQRSGRLEAWPRQADAKLEAPLK
jgi:hypothetical protein